MKGFVIEQVRNPRGRDAGVRGPSECSYMYYVVATSKEEAINLVPRELGRHVLGEYDSPEKFNNSPYNFNSSSKVLSIESFDKETSRVVEKILLCGAV